MEKQQQISFYVHTTKFQTKNILLNGLLRTSEQASNEYTS